VTPEIFHSLLRELLDENPFAIRPFLKVARVRFTEEVPTLAVTRKAAPELLVNLAFVTEHCRGDAEVKAVILHEFLHILLRHTEGRGPLSPAEHLAMDAVINALIYRHVGPEASAMMSRYYRGARGVERLLRAPRNAEVSVRNSTMGQAWFALYAGQLVVDDIRELAETLLPNVRTFAFGPGELLGNHEEMGRPLPEALTQALNDAMRTMDGGGIWRSPKGRGLGIQSFENLVHGANDAVLAWESTTLKVLREHLRPDAASRATRLVPTHSVLPVLSPRDRRAFVRTLWDPFLPVSRWEFDVERPLGTAQVYLDVSGSMNAEMPLVIGLLNRLRRFIRMPFWAFSTEVAPARIEKGALITRTTGGTSLACVLEHVARTRPECAVIVTDGYIETIARSQVAQTAPARIHALVTRDGSAKELQQAGIAYTQLPKLPT
jgi:hypothetical protein